MGLHLRYAVRLQGVYAQCGADCLSAADDRALGLRSGDSVYRHQAASAHRRGSGDLGARRAFSRISYLRDGMHMLREMAIIRWNALRAVMTGR
jgi:hypothetical protein